MSYNPIRNSVVSTQNSLTSSTMSITGGFTGTSENVGGYTTASVSFYTPLDENINGTLWFEVSRDNVDWSMIFRDIRDSSTTQPILFLITEKYFRIRFENGLDSNDLVISTVSASTIQIQSMLSSTRVMDLNQQMGNTISDHFNGGLTKSVITGRLNSSKYTNIKGDAQGSLKVNITSPRAAFGEIQISEITPQIQITFQYDIINTDIISTGETTSNGSVIQSNGMLTLSTGANTATVANASSIHTTKYRAGQGIVVRFTALFTDGVEGSVQRIGIGDENDGYAFGYSGDTFGVIRIRDNVNFFTSQSSWSVDVLDGSNSINNPSGILLNTSFGNVYQIQYQWLGFGAIKYFIEDSDTGELILVHIDKYSNLNLLPSVFNPTLAMHMHCENTTNNTDMVLKSASFAAFIEGLNEVTGPINSFQNTKTHALETSLFSLSGKTSYGGKINLVESLVKHLSVGNDVNKLAIFRIREDVIFSGSTSYTDYNTNNSVVQIDTNGSLITNGRILWSGVIGKDSGDNFILSELKIKLRPGHTLTITSECVSSGDMSAAIVWQEDF